jgi:hypothetical protein
MDIDRLVKSNGLYLSKIGGVAVTWRLLTTKEYRVFSGLLKGGIMPPFEVYEKVFDRVADQNLANDVRAGVSISIGQYCMWLSGDCENETLIDDIVSVRASYAKNSIMEFMKRTIMIAFPSKRYEEFDNDSRGEILQSFVVAEALLEARMPDKFQPLDLKKIKRAGSSQLQSIDWERENIALSKSVGDPTRDSGLTHDEIRQLRAKEGG